MDSSFGPLATHGENSTLDNKQNMVDQQTIIY